MEACQPIQADSGVRKIPLVAPPAFKGVTDKQEIAMSNLAAIAASLYDAADEMRADMDRLDARDALRSTDKYIEDMRAMRQSLRPHSGADCRVTSCNTGMIIGNFLSGRG